MTNGFINTLVAFLIGGATLCFNFKAVDASGTLLYDGEGTIVTLGDSYRMETPQMLIVSDGSTKGIYQKEIDEIVLQGVAAGGAAGGAASGVGASGSPAANSIQGIMDNPFEVLRHAGDFYTLTTWKGGKKSTSSASGALPDKIELRSKAGAVYTIGILSAKKENSLDTSSFVLDPDDYPTAVVTDLR
ncbi:MAG: hypothetical protein IKA14_04725 [Bacteroidales bacterium]|nr:hypothetical protein [Bacteroidales bacterium]